jgi:uncharacterized protein
MRFLDTNILLRYLTRDVPQKAEACYQLLQQVKEGQELVTTSEAVITEVVYVLSSKKGYRLPREDIRARLTPILSLRGFRLTHRGVYLKALNLYAAHPNLDFEDAVSVLHMKRQGITSILSYDTDFDEIAGVERVEP